MENRLPPWGFNTFVIWGLFSCVLLGFGVISNFATYIFGSLTGFVLANWFGAEKFEHVLDNEPKPSLAALLELVEKARQAERELIFSKLKSDIDKIKFFAGDDAQTVWEHLKTALKKTRELKPKGGEE